MLKQQSIDDLINFIKLNSNGSFRSTGSGYYRIPCPYCDTNKHSNYSDYHGNITFERLYFSCWSSKCNVSKSLHDFVLEQGYNNQKVITELKSLKQSKYIYGINRQNTKYKTDNSLYSNLNTIYKQFKKEHPDDFKVFLKYISNRCGDINPIIYGMSPIKEDNKLMVNFYNSSGGAITARNINNGSNSKFRYIKYSNSGYYYFQNIQNLIKYNSITISEGIFDIINISNYYRDFKDSFFFAMNGGKYNSILKYLLSKYLLIGKYNINIVFDQDVYNLNKTEYILNNIKNKINPECKLNFYIPEIQEIKDVSELMLLKRI